MKRIWIFLWALLLPSMALSAIPWIITENDMFFGDGTTSIKTLTFEMGLAGSNPMFFSNDGTDLGTNVSLNISGAISATTGISSQGDISAEGNITIGNATDSTRSITIDRDGFDPFLRWDESSQKWVFSNDGSTTANIGAGGPPDVNKVTNSGLAASVGSSALTIDLKQADGSTDPTGASPVDISFRDSTLTDGGFNTQSVTSALGITIPSGATLGTVNAIKSRIYIYAIDNAGTIELAVGNFKLTAEENVVSTTILDSSSDASNVLYSTVARSNIPIVLIGLVESTQATAGTWDTGHALLSVGNHAKIRVESCQVDQTSGTPVAVTADCDLWVDSFTDVGTGDFDLNYTNIWSVRPTCTCIGNSLSNGCSHRDNATNTSLTKAKFRTTLTNTASETDLQSSIICWGAR